MSADGSIDLFFGDGEHRFRLAIGQWRELQEKVNVSRVSMGTRPIGPADLYQLIATGGWLVDDIRETLRVGLVGGGMNPRQAASLVERYFDRDPLHAHVQTAQLVVMAALVGVPDDIVGKPTAEKTTSETTDASSSPPSTATPPRSGGRRSRSTPAHSGNSPLPSTASTEPTTPTT